MAKTKPSTPIKVGERVSVQCGDCLEILNHTDHMHAYQLAVVDSPYNIGYWYRAYEDTRKSHEFLAWCEKWLARVSACLTAHGSAWVFMGDEFVSEVDLLAKEFFYKRAHVIWSYGFGVACTKNFSRSHTHLLYYTKHRSKFTFNAEDKRIRVPSNRLLVYKDKRGNPDGKLPDRDWVLTKEAMEATLPLEGDTWYESRICGTYKERAKVSGNQLPEQVVQRIILSTSNEGDRVLDPMMGSGTVGAVALKTGRLFFGCDIDQECVKHARSRLSSTSGRNGHNPARARAAAD